MDNSKVTAFELAAGMIRIFEGCKLTSYKDAGGVWTIGYGTTGLLDGKPLGPGVTITQERAEALLAASISDIIAITKDRPILEAAALISFGYNCGRAALLRVMAGHSFPSEFTRADGKELPGLVSRRHLEELLILVSQQLSRPAGI